jgi:hypothetical protein
MTMKTFFRKSVVAGGVEVKEDMTEGEKLCTQVGTAMAVGGGVSLGVIKGFGVGVAGLACAKALVVGGVTTLGVGVGKAFVRGFVEEWHVQKVRIAMDMTKEERWMEEGKLTK